MDHYVRIVMGKDCFTIFKIKVTARSHMIKIWHFLPYHLNCWSFCHQTWFDSTLSWARLSNGEIGLLCSRSSSQQNKTKKREKKIKMSVNVCPNDSLWLAEPFAINLGMVMHHREPNCLPKRLICCLQGQGHCNFFLMSMNVCPDDIFWLTEPFTSKRGMMLHPYEPDCLSKRLVCCLQGHSWE